MRPSRRPPIPLSGIAPNRVSFCEDNSVVSLIVACPICGRWRRLTRGMLAAHRADDGATRCPGSAQRIVVDETPQAWRARLRQAIQVERGLHRLERFAEHAAAR